MAEKSQAVADLLCDEIASGLSIKESCLKAGIVRKEFYRWCWKDVDFATRIAQAREVSQEASVDENREIADSATPEDWQVKRLQIWERQWAAARRAPKKFGDKIVQEHQGPGGGPILYGWGDSPPKI